jgi:hypothetical protein
MERHTCRINKGSLTERDPSWDWGDTFDGINVVLSIGSWRNKTIMAVTRFWSAVILA